MIKQVEKCSLIACTVCIHTLKTVFGAFLKLKKALIGLNCKSRLNAAVQI